MTTWMASLNSRVTSIEPQLDLANALKNTAAANGWQQRITVHAGFASMGPPTDEKRDISTAWRMGAPGTAAKHWAAPFISLPPLLEAARNVDLVKIDTDAVDGEVLGGLISLMLEGRINVTSIIMEFMGGTAQHLFDLQQRLHFNIYRLNVHMNLRHFDQFGFDEFNHFDPLDIPPFYKEHYGLRYMRYTLKLAPLATVADFEPAMMNTQCPGQCTQFLITRLTLDDEPRYKHPMDANQPENVLYSKSGRGG